jgi:hypothetical protein
MNSVTGQGTGRIEPPGELSPALTRWTCQACGAAARRASARFCAACGRRMDEEYFPSEHLRASYRYERRPPPLHPPAKPAHETGHKRRPARRAAVRVSPRWSAMPSRDSNGASATAMAFATYALVPYLGILFCPGALLAGGWGLLRAWREPHLGGRRAAAASVALGLLLLGAQLLLWWILYKVPEWSSRLDF